MVTPCAGMEDYLVGLCEQELLEGLYECKRERRRLVGVCERARDVLEGVYDHLLLGHDTGSHLPRKFGHHDPDMWICCEISYPVAYLGPFALEDERGIDHRRK
jgi:hypothetical protein